MMRENTAGRVEDPVDEDWPVEPAPARSAWAGWIVFAGIAMIMIGSVNAIEGLVALFNAIVQLTFVSVYPVWSLAAVILCVVVIWAIVVHGNESRIDW